MGLTVEDYFPLKKRWWLRLHEKGGKINEMGCHDKLEEYLTLISRRRASRTTGKARCSARPSAGTSKLSDQPMSRVDAWYMVGRRAGGTGIEAAIGNHSFRAIGITDYMENGGDITIAHGRACQHQNHAGL